MVFFVHSDASYMTKTEARSCVGGHFFLRSPASNPLKPPTKVPKLNAPILHKRSILCHIMSSVSDAEIVGVFIKTKNAEMLRQILIGLGQTNNTTTCRIIMNVVKQH